MALLTVRAAAQQLGVAYSTLKRWVHTGAYGPRAPKADTSRLWQRDRSPARAATPRGQTPQATDVGESLVGLSARNRLHGLIDEVRIDGLLAQVRMRVGISG